MASELRKWMRKEDIYDKDLEALLEEQGIKKCPDDFKNISASQWDEIVRKGKVERFKELKDAAARSRLEKKIKKIEKVWRKQSGIKSTSMKKDTKKKHGSKKDIGSAAAQKKKKALETHGKLKKWMQKNQVWEQELFMIIVDIGVETGEDLKDKITSNDDFDECYRKVRVARAKDLKSKDAQIRMEKLMAKFEKIWRKQSGIKKSAITKKTGKGANKKNPKDKKADELSGKGFKLKKWMQKNEIWELTLYQSLVRHEIEDPDTLAKLPEKEFDDIIRQVRVDRFKDLKDQPSRNRLDKLLVKFEAKWRKESGIKKTSIKKKGDESKDNESKEEDAPVKDEPKEQEEEPKEADAPKEEAEEEEAPPKEEEDAPKEEAEEEAPKEEDAGDDEKPKE